MPFFSFKDAAIKVLQESKRPMSAVEIYETAVVDGLVKTSGKTPEETMAAQIYVDIKKRGDKSPFVKVGRGVFAIAAESAKEKTPEQIILEYNKVQREALKERLMKINPYVFECLVGDLLKKLGYEDVKVTKRSGDGGIDVTANLTAFGFANVKTAVQVKRYTHNVSDNVVRELRGAAEVDQKGLIITTADFTRAAKEEAAAPNKTPISLVNGEKLLSLLIERQIGVKTEQKTLFSINEAYFTELEGSDYGSTSEKKRAIWPLPGGIDHYYESLLLILKNLKGKSLSRENMVKWFKANFENVNSEQTVFSYLGTVFSNLGLIQYVGKKYQLTTLAETFLTNPSKQALYVILNDHIFGIDETMSLIENSDEPITAEDLRVYLTENNNIDWNTDHQASFRLLWLWNLEKICRTSDGKYTRK